MQRRGGSWYHSDVAANIYQAVKQAMQDLVAPQLESLKGEMSAIRVDIRRVEEKLSKDIQSVRTELSTEIHRIDEKLTWALDLRERIIILETKLGVSGSGS